MAKRKQTYLEKKYYVTSVGKRHRRIIKMLKKINPYLYIGGAMFVLTIMYIIYDHLIQYSQEIFFVLATLTVMLVISVIIYLGNLIYGTVHHAKRTKIETDRLEAVKEQEAGKGEQERNKAGLLYVEADKTKAETEHRRAETEHLKTETMGQQIENAYNSVKVQAAQAFLPHADNYYKRILEGAKPPSLTFSGGTFSLKAPTSKTVINESENKMIGDGQNFPNRIDLLDMLNGEKPNINKIILGLLGDGNVLSENFSSLVHILIVGMTRFGKSTFIEMLLYQLLMCGEHISFILIDTGGTTFSDFGLPFIDDIDEALNKIIGAIAECYKRKDLFNSVQGRKPKTLSQYNVIAEANGLEVLPWIVIIMDEGLDLMEQSDNIKKAVKKLIAWAGKYGVTLVLASQDGKANTLPTEMRGQFGSRFVFKFMEKSAADAIIKNCGATDIDSKGRFKAVIPGFGEIVECQSPILDGQYIYDTFSNGDDYPDTLMQQLLLPEPSDELLMDVGLIKKETGPKVTDEYILFTAKEMSAAGEPLTAKAVYMKAGLPDNGRSSKRVTKLLRSEGLL